VTRWASHRSLIIVVCLIMASEALAQQDSVMVPRIELKGAFL
jgi:hypothetical protein